MDVDGRLAKRNSSDKASSRSLRASTKVGYLSFIIWSREILVVPFFSNLAASPTSPLPSDLLIFLANALCSRNLLSKGSWRRY